MKAIEAFADMIEELERAQLKHPSFPTDPVHAVAIMVEEAGEAMQAALDFTYSGGTLDHLQEELIQTGAMAIRALKHLELFQANSRNEVVLV